MEMQDAEPRSVTNKKIRTSRNTKRAAETGIVEKRPSINDAKKKKSIADYKQIRAKYSGVVSVEHEQRGIFADISAIEKMLSEFVLIKDDRIVNMKIAKSIQQVMMYDVTKDKIWPLISKNCETMRIYSCDPDPKTFSLNENTVEGRGNILLSYETEVFPGSRDEMSVSLPARFRLVLENGEPRVTSVEI